VGTWGPGPFDNDDAAPVIEELTDTSLQQTTENLQSLMAAALKPNEYVEAPVMSAAIAAACIIAVALGAPSPHPNLTDWLQDSGFGATSDLRRTATQVLSRVTASDNNEWYDLWRDAGRLDKVLAEIRPYHQELANTG
jgi:hypothetical protein